MSTTGADRPRGHPVAIAPRFYARRLGPRFASPADALGSRVPAWFAPTVRRPGFAQGIALGMIARRRGRVALIRRDRGTLTALWVASLPPARRGIFVLELLRRPMPRAVWRRMLYRLWWRLVETPALRRGMAGAQVMTPWERDEYAAHYGLDPERLHVVRWALRSGNEAAPVPVRAGERGVFASGRTACDWETLFEAATGTGWELCVVCSDSDRPRVERLARDSGAKVLSELPDAEYEGLLRAHALSAIVLAERGLSAGQVRLMSAVSAGVPVVASRVRSLHEYVVDGETAVLVPPGDAAALRRAVDDLLEDPDRRLELREAALRRGAAWTYDEYFATLRPLVLAAQGGRFGGETA